jgi:hypothetical protein
MRANGSGLNRHEKSHSPQRNSVCYRSRRKKDSRQIDLKEHGGLWEDFYDVLIAKQRKDEPRESLESVKRRLRRAGKLDG